MIKNKDLKRRILEISYKHGLSHLGSCLTAVDIIDEIFSKTKKEERFVLSSGHAGLALYVGLEKWYQVFNFDDKGQPIPKDLDAEDIFNHHGVHPDRCKECHIDCSTGSLGQGLPIAVGMALADRSKDVYCLISDGEYAEGSIQEALRIKEEQELDNLKVYLNYNGWGAYRQIKGLKPLLSPKAKVNVIYTDISYLPFLIGQEGHYKVMNEKEYNLAMEILG